MSYFLFCHLILYLMVKSLKANVFFGNLKFSCLNAIRTNKIKFLIVLFLVMVAIATGVFVAIKSNNNCTLYNLQEIDLENFYSGVTASSSAFLSRSLSLLVNVAILSILAFSPYLFPLACTLFVFRAYLLGLNFALIFVFYGIGSIFTAVIIILPCQLLMLFGLVLFYIVLQKMNSNCRCYGSCEVNRLAFVLLGFVLLILINFVETLLLCLLSGKVILVI